MWSGDSTHLDYPTYSYRIPSPQEFLLNCNLALMRGAVALFPYCLRSYSGTTANGDSYFTVGYLDNNNMPFDAPYEEWVYTDRWRSDYDVIPPDSFPPFSDSCRVCGDFDPLWDLPSRPTTTGERATEDYLMWKFAAYARRWNSFRKTFAQVAAIAPELTQLHWWEDYAECLDAVTLNDRVEPHIRLFNDGNDNGYAFYVNRNCYDPEVAVNIILWPDTIPSGVPYNAKLLDHSRRFLMELQSDLDYDYHSSVIPSRLARQGWFSFSPGTSRRISGSPHRTLPPAAAVPSMLEISVLRQELPSRSTPLSTTWERWVFPM